MLPDEPTDEEWQEELPQDNGTPFQPAAPNPDPIIGVTNDPLTQAANNSVLDDTHPVTDTNVQPEEQYDEGTAGATEAQEPNAGNATAGFAPPADALPPEEGDAASPDDSIEPAGPDSEDVVVG